MNAAIESYKEMADFGGNLGIKVTFENHWGLAADPMNLRIMIDTINHPYCDATPDFCNWEHEYMLFNGLKALAPYSHSNVHAKYWDRWGDKNDVQRSCASCSRADSRARSRSSTRPVRSTASKARSTSTRKSSRRWPHLCEQLSKPSHCQPHTSRAISTIW